MNKATPLNLSTSLGTHWWNDSCDLNQLKQAVENGASGATSNPYIVYQAIKNNQNYWIPKLKNIIQQNPHLNEDQIAWKLIDQMAMEAAEILYPVFEKTNGQHGKLSIQVNPKYFNQADLMVEHGKHLAQLAPNITIKAPSTQEGFKAFEELTACGISVNATVSFSISQVIQAAEAIERGMEKARKNNLKTDSLTPYITIMVGRIDDQLRREVAAKNMAMDPSLTHWGGIAVFKKAYQIFKKKKYGANLLAAAYRNPMQWTQLNGPNVTMTIPYPWWQSFQNSDYTIQNQIEKDLAPEIIEELYKKLEDFRLVYDDEGLYGAQKIMQYGATQYTLNQFLTGQDEFVKLVRNHMLNL
jgi:transaldolase